MTKKFIGFLMMIMTVGSLSAAVKSHVTAMLLSEVDAIQPGASFDVGVQIIMEKGWHTYWRNPGESGTPTKIKWMLPPHWKAGESVWPYPHKILTPPVVSFGYDSSVVLLTSLTPPSNLKLNSLVPLKGHVDWLECQEECIPGAADVELNLPVEKMAQPNTTALMLFQDARFHLPIKMDGWVVKASRNDQTLRIEMNASPANQETLGNVEFFPYEKGIVDLEGNNLFQSHDGGGTLDMALSSTSGQSAATISGVLVNRQGWRGPGSERAMEVSIPIINESFQPISSSPSNASLPFSLALLFAFLGGLLLNIMPCVLPVLSIKILSLVQHRDRPRSEMVRMGLAYTVGVVLSFLSLALVVHILRIQGQHLGWGFQLQSPLFVLFLINLFLLMGLNVFGVFEVGTSFTRLAGYLPKQSGLISSFMGGVMATLVATPCTAPFMGSALGFALTQSPAKSFLIFIFLGLGMASPFLLVSFIPSWSKKIPKPGPWMTTFKQLMGILFFATALWLFKVLSDQKYLNLVPLLGGLLSVAISSWIYGTWVRFDRRLRVKIIGGVLSLIFLIGGAVYSIQQLEFSPSLAGRVLGDPVGEGISWEEFSPAKLTELRKLHKPIFIDFTASWCLTCQVNERITFHSESVIQAFKDKGLVALKADWTNRNDVITQALNDYGRIGVPVYVLYVADSHEAPLILPSVLTPGVVLAALKKI